MLDQTIWSEVDALQSLPFHLLTGRGIHSGHGEIKFHTVIFNAAIFRYFPMRVREAGEKAGHHGMNRLTVFAFSEISGVIGGVVSKQGLNKWEIVIVG